MIIISACYSIAMNAQESVERLFAEPFTPNWMHNEVLAISEDLSDLIASTEFNYKQKAYEKLQLISFKHPPKKPLKPLIVH